jgi:hypothetical protein
MKKTFSIMDFKENEIFLNINHGPIIVRKLERIHPTEIINSIKQ